MKIKIPVIEHVDVVFAGTSVAAVQKAAELQEMGFKCCLISGFSYMGEDLCAFFDLQSPKSPDCKNLIPQELPTPLEVKSALEQKALSHHIPFYYQTFPARAVLDSEGKIAGLVTANRSGFQVIEAKVIIDASIRFSAGMVCGIPMKKFQPGRKKVERWVLSTEAPAEHQGLSAEKLPLEYTIDSQKFPVWHLSMEMDFPDNSAKTLAEAECAMREISWTAGMTYAGDQCKMTLDDGFAEDWVPTEKLPVFPIQKADTQKVVELIRNKKHLSPVCVADDPQAKGSSKVVSRKSGSDIVRKDVFHRFEDCPSLEFELNSIARTEETDVLVCGLGTGGAPAVIAAGREGVHTIGIEALYGLGGICTLGRICCYYYGNRIGFTREMDDKIFQMGASPKYPADSPLNNIEWKQQFLLQECRKGHADLRFGTLAAAVAMDGNRVTGVAAVGNQGLFLIQAKAVVDASGNADLTAMAGGETDMSSPEEPAIQGAAVAPLVPNNDYTNSDYQFICDHDVLDFTRAMVMSRGKFAGTFDTSPIADTRERRRIVGQITLQPQDFYAHRCYSDTINIATSNFDTHGFTIHSMFLLKPTTEDAHFAKVPFRALLPRGLEGIIATGLGISAHRDCMPLIRMQPDIQNHGYAAGLAAAAAAKENKTFHEISIRDLQKKLIEEKCLPEEILQETDAIPGPDEKDPHCMLSNVFLHPQESIPSLKKQFAENPDPDAAALLAFLGEKDG